LQQQNVNNRGAFLRFAIMLGLIVLFVMFFRGTSGGAESYTYANLVHDINQNNVDRIEIIGSADVAGTGRARVFFRSINDRGQTVERVETVVIPWMDEFSGIVNNAINEHNLLVTTSEPSRIGAWFQILLMPILMVVMMLFMIANINRAQGGGSDSKAMNFGKSRARMLVDDKKKYTFANVAGLEEEKEELKEIVDFLKMPKKYIDIGARIPKGILLAGPPGTGKTILAKAIAGEADATFFTVSGADFVEMFVGVGASRVRDLFEQAKRHVPCIIFIDEIDAVGRKRGAGLGGGHDEREQTLNQLLIEMDGFGVNEGIIVMAATNRPDVLDPALLRPGRFDRRVVVGRPDVKAREQILRVHAKNKQIAENLDLSMVAQTTSGFTGADLENLLNEAALLAIRSGKEVIEMEEVRRAIIKVGVGTEKKSRVVSDKEKFITAYHEAGHAIIHELCKELDPVNIISIIPTGMAGGYTMPLPGEDRMYLSKKHMQEELIALLGGRAAEFIVIEDITTGASNDIARATAMARNMVTKYGMSDALGPIQFGNDNDEVFIGRDFAQTRNYGEGIASLIDSEIKNLVEGSYKKAIEILTANIELLHSSAKLLIEREKITGDEFRALFPAGVLG